MKIFLQHTQSQFFFNSKNDWTPEMASARLFSTTQELWAFCAAHRLNDVQMIVQFDDPRFDMTVPVILPTSLESRSPQTILLVEDNADDILLIQRAFRKTEITDSVQVVTDGEQAMAYLSGEGIYSDRSHYPMPRLIVMDLKMPRMTGLELLRWMNSVQVLQPIPKIILSSSRLDSDVAAAYDLGANTYFAKPNAFEDLLLLVKSIHDYWLFQDNPKEETHVPFAPLRQEKH